MSTNISNKDIINKFKEEFQNSEVVNFNEEKSDSLELLTPSYNTFFDMLFSQKKFKIETFFDHTLSSEDGMIEFNGKKILRKKTYSKENLVKYLTKNELGFDRITTTSLPIFQDNVLSKFVDKEDIFLSYGNLYYQLTGNKTISVSPLVFFKVKIEESKNEYYLSLDYNSPLYNYPLIDLIKRTYKIDIGSYSEGFDYLSYLKRVEKVTKKLLFGVDDSIHIYQKDIFHWIKIKHLIDIWPKVNSSVTFRSLDEPIKKHNSSKFEYHSNHAKYITDGLDLLQKKSIVKLEDMNPLSKTFIESSIEEHILNRKNVVIISPDSSTEKEINREINSHYYDVFTPYKDFTKPNIALFNYFEAIKKNRDIILDSNALVKRGEIKECVQKHREIDTRIKDITIPTGENSLEVFDSYYKHYTKSTNLFEFDQDDEYEYEDYLADMDFLDALDNLGQIASEPFVKHPYYGLNSATKSEEYKNIIKFLNTFIKDIEEFDKNINDSGIKLSDWSDFNSIRDYDDSETLLSVFADYESFPLEYFDIEFTDEILDKLEELKEYYRLEASMKLSIDMVCRPSVWNMDFEKIIERVSTGRGENQTRKEFKSIMKINANRRNFRALIVLFNKYLINRKNKEKLYPEMRKIFNNKVDNIDDIVSIEKAYEFIKSYNRNIMLYSTYNFDNKFTKNIFHNSDFLEVYKKKYYPSLTLSRSVFEHDLDQYHKYFNEDKFDYISASFDQIIEMLKRKINSNQEEFDKYLQFSIRADESSRQLRDALDEVEEKKGNLLNFKNDYLTSLYKYLLIREFKNKNGLQLSEENSKNTFEFYRLLNRNPNVTKLDIVRAFATTRKNLLNRPSYEQTVKSLKEKYHYTKLFSARDAIKICGEEFFHLYPLYSTNMDKVDILGKYQFDLAIIFANENTSLLDIYNSISFGKKCLIVNSGNRIFDNVEKLNLNLKRDLVNYNRYSKTSKIFRERFESALSRQDINIVKNKEIDDGITIPYYYEKHNQKYAMRLEVGYRELDETDLFEIPSLLYYYYGIKTVFQYPLNFMLYEDLNIMAMYKDVKEYIDKKADYTEKNIENMSYDQKKKYLYFETLNKIDESFEYYKKAQETATEISENKLTRSKISERPIVNISYLEIANGIITYLEHFTYLDRDVLINHISNVVGTDGSDIDFRLLFAKAENYLTSDHIIFVEKNRMGLIRE